MTRFILIVCTMFVACRPAPDSPAPRPPTAPPQVRPHAVAPRADPGELPVPAGWSAKIFIERIWLIEVVLDRVDGGERVSVLLERRDPPRRSLEREARNTVTLLVDDLRSDTSIRSGTPSDRRGVACATGRTRGTWNVTSGCVALRKERAFVAYTIDLPSEPFEQLGGDRWMMEMALFAPRLFPPEPPTPWTDNE